MRIEKLYSYIEEYSAQGALVLNPSDIFYLAGVKTSGVFILKDEEPVVYIPSVSFEESKKVINKNIKCKVFRNEIPWDEISLYLKGKKVAVDPASISYKTYKNINDKFNLIFVDDLVSRQRIVKEPDELNRIRKACGITAEIFSSIDAQEWLGRREIELAFYLEQQAWKNGGSGNAFKPIVAAGVNSAYPHHEPLNDYIAGGWLKIDYGVIHNGYCSDLTRTYILDKFLNDLDGEKLLMDLTEAKDKAVELLRPGIKCSDIYDAAREHLEVCGLAEYFIHSLGHGVGIDIHEKPYLKLGETQALQENMVVTVEPGFYMPGIGGMRVEDTYLVTEKGAEKLTRIYQ